MEELNITPEVPQEEATDNKKKEDETLYQRRDISECLGAAWTLLSTNFKRICKTMALPVLLFAIAMSLYVHYTMDLVSLVASVEAGNSNDISAGFILGFVASIILFIAATFYLCGVCMTLLNGHTVRYNVWRYIKQSLAMLTVIVVAYTIITGISIAIMTISETTGILVLFLLFILFLFAIMPLIYTTMKYFIEDDKKVSVIFKAYRKGLKHYWFILGTMILTTILIYVISLIVQLPMTIATLAQMFSTMGVAMGDPTGLPESFSTTMFITSFISAIVQGATFIYMIFVQYYIYGSVEARLAAEKNDSANKTMV